MAIFVGDLLGLVLNENGYDAQMAENARERDRFCKLYYLLFFLLSSLNCKSFQLILLCLLLIILNIISYIFSLNIN